MLESAIPVVADSVIFNEIMYHAAPATPEPDNLEWVELFNKGTNAVNLNGWKLSKGVKFTFPNVTLPAGGFVVVAANSNSFASRYPNVQNALGDWVGVLGNNGDELQLQNAAGDVVDDVVYGSQGDWAIRQRGPFDITHYGWEWFTEADGLGKSLELRNPNLSNKYGQNWMASVAAGGTPGSANSARTNDLPPMILEASHFPVVPKSTNNVTVTARVVDELATGVVVTLFYRLDANPQVPVFSSVPMTDGGTNGDGIAGDGVYGAVLPIRPNNAVVEYYVSATDATGHTRTWPAPARQTNSTLPQTEGQFAQTANALYQVIDDFNYAGGQPLYQAIMTEIERVELDAIGRNVNGAANSDAAMNGSFVSIDGTGTEVRQQVSFRNRGHGSRTARPNNVRVEFPNDQRWKGVRNLNLNTRFVYCQVFGSALFQKSGLPMANSKPVQVRVNGTTAGGGAPTYGSYAHNEELSSDFAGNHFPEDASGNVYRGIRIDSPQAYANLTYLGPDVTACQGFPNCYTNLYFKQNNVSEFDFSDLIELTRVLSDNTLTGTQYVSEVRRVLNVEEALLYFAVNTLVDNSETSLSNGNGDDYAMYRGGIDRRFRLLPYDTDTIMGEGDSAGSITASLFRMNAGPGPGAAIPKLTTNPQFVPIYYAQLKHLIETTFSAQELSPLMDRVLGGFVPAGTLSAMKSWQASRNAFVLSQIPLTYSAVSSLSQSSGFYYTTTATAPVNGTANAIDTRTVLVNGLPANYNAQAGTWNISGIPLLPGINRVQAQFLGTNGVEVGRASVDIWYDTGPSVEYAGTLPANTVWSAASGPYLVSSALTVPSGVTLTIGAGTTIFLAPGATITVNGTGRILGQGTEAGHIRLTRQPGSANWGSLDFINATSESRLAYVDIDFCGGTTIGGHNAEIHVNNNSVVFFDHLTFANTPVVEYISFDGSSFVVQNSTFPRYPPPTGPEMLHGVNGIPAGGYGIFRGNYFGHTYGFNDTIDFTGGNRPSAILQVIGNVFDGSGDDNLDLDSTDAWIEGNIFMHVHRDPNRTDDARDTGSAISGGVDFANQYSEWTIINNLFYDLDHAVLNKQGGRFIFANNTLVHVAKENGAGLTNDIGAFDFTDDGLALPDASIGAGAYVANNIIWDVPQLTANYNPANHNVIFDNNILPRPWTGPGTNNIVIDPDLNLSLITNVTTADWRTVLAALAPRAGSAALGSGIGGFDRGGMNAKGLLIYGEPVGTTALTSATLSLFPGGTFSWGSVVPPYVWGYTHYKWKLDNGAWSAETSITASPTINLTGLANGPHTVYVSGKSDAGYYQDDPFVYPTNSAIPAHVTASRTWTVNTGYTKVLLNEVLAQNVSAVLNGEEYVDVVELYNAGGSPLALDGMGLSDDPADKFKYRFPAGTSLGAGQYLGVFGGNGGGGAPGLHFGFKLSANGGTLLLYSTNGTLLDSVTYGLQLPNLSIGRAKSGEWVLSQPTFGAANVAQPLGPAANLKINEWLASGQTLYPDDFIEIFNTGHLPVDVSRAYISDAPQGDPTLDQIAPLSFIGGDGYLVLIADGQTNAGVDHLNFKLSPDQGQIALFSPERELIDCILYGAQTTDVSEGRQPSGAEIFAFFATPTPGGPNSGSSVVVSNTIVNVLDLTANWRYNAQGSPGLGTAWRATGYNDTSAGWTNGRAVFWHSTQGATIPYPVNTDLPFTSPIQTTFYFRTTFNYVPNSSGTNFMISHVIDDGLVVYLNGQEVYHYNMVANPAYGTLALSTIGNNPALLGPFPFPTTNLVAGTNVLAVEVHQASTTSSDIGMGIVIDDVRSVTNLLSTPIVLNEIMANNRSQTNADGTITDWLELFNPANLTLDVSDMSLSDSVSQPRRWVVPSGVSMPANSYLLIRLDGTTPPTSNAAPVLNAGFALKGDGDQVYLFDSLARGGALVDSVTFGLQVPDYTVGRVPNGRGRWVLNLPTANSVNIQATLADSRNLKVNEWMAAPASGSDWFELYNPNNNPVSLGGLYLTDNLNIRSQSRIPDLSFIGGGEDGFLRFEADNPSSFKGANHVNFKLDGTLGEQLGIFTGAGILIDGITFGPQTTDLSEGRFPDGATNIVAFPGTASPGESNIRQLLSVVINEALAHSTDPLEDAVELHNITQSSIDLSGWFLTDKRSDPFRFRIPDGTIIQPGGYQVFYEYQLNPNQGIPPSFALSSAHGEELYLFTADLLGNLTGYRTGVKFGASANGASFGAYQTSVGSDFTTLSHRTFGVDAPASLAQFRAGSGLANAYPEVGPVVINEIQYHPPEIVLAGVTNDNTQDEFVELYNFSTNAVALYDPAFPTNHWKLRDAVDFDFPPGLTIPAGGFLVVVGFDPATNAAQLSSFRTRFDVPPGVAILGPLLGKLDNSSDSVELVRPDAPVAVGLAEQGFVPYYIADRVKYADSIPWPAVADGSGNSLQRRTAWEYGNDPVNWIAGVATPGSGSNPPAGAPPVINSLTGPQTVALGASATLTVSASGVNLVYQWRVNGFLIAGATNASLAINAVQATNAGVYQVLVSNADGSSASATTLTVQLPPVIVQQPMPAVAPNGGRTYFGVTVQGLAPLSYQWYKDGGLLAGQIGASVVLTNLQPISEGNYFVVITNVFGAVTSSPASLTLNAAPVITSQPQSTNVFVGSDVLFSASALGTAPLRYQWRFNGSALTGATNPALSLLNVQPTNAGGYSVSVANNVGSITSAVATLIVTIPPTVTITASDPTAAEAGANTGAFTISRTGNTGIALTVNFTVGGSATPGSDYTALSGPVTIPAGSVSANLVVSPLDDVLLESNETVIVTIAPGSTYAIGNPASATVAIIDNDNQAPSVTITNPLTGTVLTTPVNLSIGATASDGDGSVAKVEFYYGGTNKIGETLSTPYVITWTNAVAGTQSLTAIAYDNLGATSISAPVSIVLNSPPTVNFISPTNGGFFFAPATVNLAVSAIDSDGIVQVQFFAGTNLLGFRTTAPYSLAQSNLPAGSYTFSASATDARGATAFAAPVTVTVGVPAPGFTNNFAERGVLSGYTNRATGNSSTFTQEPGEPKHDGKGGTHSGWISWLAPASGQVSMDTFGSGFDTVLAVYTGTAVDGLVYVASNDDASDSTLQSGLAFNAVGGTLYNIAVDGYNSSSAGPIVFTLDLSNPNPKITAQPQSQIVNQGGSGSFNVTAAGQGPLRYQWFFNGGSMPGATNNSLAFVNARATNEGAYFAVVSNTSGSVTSLTAVLTVRIAPTFLAQPQAIIVNPGSNGFFTVGVSGSAPLTYQWRFNGSDMSGATGSNLTLAAVQYTNGGNYSVSVGNSAGVAVSQPAELTVRPSIVGGRWTNGAFVLNLNGTPGKRYSIEASSTFSNWSSVGAVTNSTVPAQFSAPLTPSTNIQAYRLRLLP